MSYEIRTEHERSPKKNTGKEDAVKKRSGKKRSENKDPSLIYKVCTVRVEGFESRMYDYLPLEDTKAGDYVIVPFGWENTERVAFVQKVEQRTRFDKKIPYEQLKKVLRPYEDVAEDDIRSDFAKQKENLEKQDIPILPAEEGAYVDGDFVYRKTGDGALLVKYIGKGKKVVVPDRLGGRKVTEIGEYAFYEFGGIKIAEVVLPKYVKIIRKKAFGFCERIKKLVIPDGTKVIEASAIHGCDELILLDVPASVESISGKLFDSGSGYGDLGLNEHIVIVVDRGSYAEEFFRNYETNSEFYPNRHLPVRYRGEMNDEPDEDYEDIFEYTISDDGTVHIDEILVGGDVVIPSKIHGCPVTEVNCSLSETTNSITFPDADIFLSGIDDDSTDDGWEEKIFDNYFHLDRLVLPEKSTRYRTDGFAVFSADLKKLYKFYSSETGYTVPEGTERICTGAFAGSKIEEVDLPDSLKEIGNCAFGNCRNFRRINGGRNLISVSGYFAYMAPFKIDDEMILGKTLVNAAIKEKSYHIPEGVETISAEAFEDSEGLEEIYLPASLKTIEDHAFGVKLTHLKNIYAPDGCGNFVTIDGALYSNDLKELYYVPYDYNISTLSIHHLVKRIHNQAIHNAHVTRLEFEGVVEDFGRTAVYACEKLEEVIFADGQKNLAGKDIDGILSRCPNISKIHLPKKLEVIGRDFCMDASIREIDFPKKLKEIGDCAFRSNPIEYLTLPRSLKTVGDSAFGGALKRVTLYDNLLSNTRYRKERRTSGYQIECQSSIPLLSLNYNQKNPYEVVVLSAEDDHVKVRVLMPGQYYSDDSRAFSKMWNTKNQFSFEDEDLYFPNLQADHVAFAAYRLAGETPVQKNREMMIRILKNHPAQTLEFCKEALDENAIKKLEEIGIWTEKSTGDNVPVPEGYKRFDRAELNAPETITLDHYNQPVQGYFRGLTEDVERMKEFFRDRDDTVRYVRRYNDRISEGWIHIEVLKLAMQYFPAIKFSGMMETRRGKVNVFYSPSGYPYITAWCVVGYYDHKSDWNWDWDCDFFGGYHDKMTYIQTGGCERIDYEYPFMDEWCDGKYYHEEDGELFEPVDKEGLACKKCLTIE